MGIDKLCLKSILKEGKKKHFSGKVLALGKQDVYFSYEDLVKIAKEFAYPIKPISKQELSLKDDLKKEKYISDSFLFRSLGFSEYKSLDVSDYESADYIFDLNSGALPEFLINKFDAIFDCGTIEHVFNLPNALNNVYKMLKKSGKIFHYSPSINYVDHGFYMFSPTFFGDFYTENKFEINSLKFIKHSLSINTRWESSNYNPGTINCFSFKPSGEHLYIIECIVTKNKNSTGNKIPQQFCYRNENWNNKVKKPIVKEENEIMVIKNKFNMKGIKFFIKKIIRKLVK